AAADFVGRRAWIAPPQNANVLPVGNLETRRTILAVRDRHRALILLLDRGESGEAYNLGGTTTYAMSAVLSQVLGRATRHDIIPEIDPRLLRPTDEPVIWADCSKIKAATGWEPIISLGQTIDDML